MDWAALLRYLMNGKAVTVEKRLDTDWKEVVPYSDHRLYLILSNVSSEDMQFVAGNNDDARISTGFGGGFQGQSIFLSIWEHGALVKGPIWGMSQGGSTGWSYTEVLYPPP